MSSCVKHDWTKVAPEWSDAEGMGREVWKWCIHCGWLRLGQMIFVPGVNQTPTLKAHVHTVRKDASLRRAFADELEQGYCLACCELGHDQCSGEASCPCCSDAVGR